MCWNVTIGKEHGIIYNSIRTLPRIGWKLSWSQVSVRWSGRNYMGKGKGMGLRPGFGPLHDMNQVRPQV